MSSTKQEPTEGTLHYVHAAMEHIVGDPDDGVSQLEWLGYSVHTRNTNDAMNLFRKRGMAPYAHIEGADGGGFILCRPSEEMLVQLRADRGEADFPCSVDIQAVH